MKIRIALLAVLCTQVCSAGLTSRLELCRPLIHPPEKGVTARLKVPSDVFDQTRSFPDDVRILDSEETQWPFFLLVPTDRSLSKKRTPQVLNKAFVGGAEAHWELDLVMPNDGERAVHNQLEIITSGTDFVRRVEISRRMEDKKPAQVGTGYLIRFPDAQNARNERISYPDSNAGRLHLKVYTNAKNADETFDIQHVAIYSKTAVPAERDPVPAVRCPVPEKERVKRAQVILLDSGFKNQPVEFIRFDIADESFVRCVSVFGRNAENEPWRNVGSGGIHRFEKGEQTTVHIRAVSRWIKIVVRQDDNLPLDIQSIHLEAIPRYLVFEAVNNLPARLCFRGWDIPRPKYDLKRRVSKARARSLPVIALGKTESHAPPSSLSVLRKYSGILSSVVVGFVALMVIWVIIRMMRQQPAETE